jgi:hypothetical protein
MPVRAADSAAKSRAKAASGSSCQQTPRVPRPLASSAFQPGYDEDLLGILGVLLGEGPRKKKKTRKPAPAEHKCKRCGEPFTRSPGSNTVCMTCHLWALRGQTCDACQIANGYLRCKDCAVLCPPALLDKHGSCQKCRGLRTPRTSSVRTVSGGLPTLRRRR